MHYCVWGTVEKDTNHIACSTKSQLIDRIKEASESMKTACARFRSRIDVGVDGEDDFYE